MRHRRNERLQEAHAEVFLVDVLPDIVTEDEVVDLEGVVRHGVRKLVRRGLPQYDQ